MERITNLLEDLDAINKLESGTIKMKMERFDLVILSKEIFGQHELDAKENKCIKAQKEEVLG